MNDTEKQSKHTITTRIEKGDCDPTIWITVAFVYL